MPLVHPGALAAGAAVSLLSLWFSLRQRRRHRLLKDLPTSKTQGVFIGQVEVAGTAESEAPLRSYLAEAACVHYAWSVEEHWRRVRVESYTDSKGNRRTRTRVESGWTEVASGGELQQFYLQDDTGVILVDPDGATIEPQTMFSETVGRSHPLYYGRGPDGAVANSTGTRRFVEKGIPLHAAVFALAHAREREDVVAPMLAKEKGVEFLLSCRGEAAVQRGLAAGSWATWVLGLAAMPAAIYFGRDPVAPGTALVQGGLALSAAYLLVWSACWVWMVHNSLVNLRERVRQGWSLVEVQLKRRHDLIPQLESVVRALAAHEQDVQTVLAALRAQAGATRPGEPGADHAALAPTVRALAEAYPDLVAAGGFSDLQRELVTTEQRIALARTYYNDIATQYATRLQQVPDRWVGGLRDLKPEPLLAAADFERASVQVSFAS